MKKRNYLLLFILLTFAGFSASAFVNNVVNSPNMPTVCDSFTLTVNGDLPGTNFQITSVSQNISGNTITLDVFIQDQGIGIPVLVPYFVNFNYSGLDEGSYNIIARDFINGNFSSSVNSSITITGFTSATTTNITNTSATLNWSEIPCACEYLLKGRPVGASNYIFVPIVGSSTTSFNVANLVPGTSYEWQVLTNCPATGADTARAKTQLQTFTTGNCNIPNPATTTNVTGNTATLNWTAVTGAIGYQILGRAVGGSIVTLNVNNGSTTSFQVNNLPAQTTFEWAVRTKCAAAPDVFSGFSAIQTFTTTTNSGKNVRSSEIRKATVSPNPMETTAVLTIPETGMPLSLVISDLSGRIVHRVDNIHQNQLQLSKGDLNTGIYLYELFNAKHAFSGKFLIN